MSREKKYTLLATARVGKKDIPPGDPVSLSADQVAAFGRAGLLAGPYVSPRTPPATASEPGANDGEGGAGAREDGDA